MEDSEKQQSIREQRIEQIKPWQFKKGQSGNPAGRPPTKTLKEFARQYLAGLNDEERIEYFEGLDKRVIWEMAEGKPETKTDITTGGDKIQPVLVRFIGDNGDTNTD
jgi:hypothetical protein